MDRRDLDKAIDALIEDAYQRGFADGKKAITDSLMQLAQTVTPAANDAEPSRALADEATVAEHYRPKSSRAPRGLTEYVMRRVLSFYWMPVEEIQKKAVEIDSRVSPKTVYNTLYRYPELFEKDENNRWRRRHNAHAEGDQSVHDQTMEGNDELALS